MKMLKLFFVLALIFQVNSIKAQFYTSDVYYFIPVGSDPTKVSPLCVVFDGRNAIKWDRNTNIRPAIKNGQIVQKLRSLKNNWYNRIVYSDEWSTSVRYVYRVDDPNFKGTGFFYAFKSDLSELMMFHIQPDGRNEWVERYDGTQYWERVSYDQLFPAPKTPDRSFLYE